MRFHLITGDIIPTKQGLGHNSDQQPFLDLRLATMRMEKVNQKYWFTNGGLFDGDESQPMIYMWPCIFAYMSLNNLKDIQEFMGL